MCCILSFPSICLCGSILSTQYSQFDSRTSMFACLCGRCVFIFTTSFSLTFYVTLSFSLTTPISLLLPILPLPVLTLSLPHKPLQAHCSCLTPLSLVGGFQHCNLLHACPVFLLAPLLWQTPEQLVPALSVT